MRFAFSLVGICSLMLAALPAAAETPKRMTGLIGGVVMQSGVRMGVVSDVTLDRDGRVETLIVRTGDGTVAVPYSSARYDSRQRAYVVANEVSPRLIEQTPQRDRAATSGDRFSRGASLDRTETPPARLERVPARKAEYVFSSPQLRDLAQAARTYSTPSFSVSMTGNVDRLPARSAYLSNDTTASEAYGWRDYRRLPPPIAFTVPTTAK